MMSDCFPGFFIGLLVQARGQLVLTLRMLSWDAGFCQCQICGRAPLPRAFRFAQRNLARASTAQSVRFKTHTVSIKENIKSVLSVSSLIGGFSL